MSKALDDDRLLTLKDACEVFFGGRVTIATLKGEHARGNLELSKIGRSYFTTIAKLKEMDQKCRVDPPARNSGSTKPVASGPLRTAASGIAQDSALTKLNERMKHLGITSRNSTR